MWLYFYKSFLRNIDRNMNRKKEWKMFVEYADSIGANVDFASNTHSTQFQKCGRKTQYECVIMVAQLQRLISKKMIASRETHQRWPRTERRFFN